MCRVIGVFLSFIFLDYRCVGSLLDFEPENNLGLCKTGNITLHNTVPRVENAEKCVLLELQSHCYSRDGDNYNAVECLRNCLHLQRSGGNEFEYAESNYILGAAFYKSRKFDSALSVFQSALSYDIEPEWKEKIEAYVIQIEKDKEADESERVKRANELIASEEKLKKETEDKKRKTKNKSKKAVENIPAWQSQKILEYSASFKVILNRKLGRRCYMGILESKSCKLLKSFVGASPCHINNCEELVSLGHRHECLLKVEHCIALPVEEKSKEFLVTKAVYRVRDFFVLEYEKFKSESSNQDESFNQDLTMWWNHISKNYWRIFRDISRGLMFLYEKTRYVCGDMFGTIAMWFSVLY